MLDRLCLPEGIPGTASGLHKRSGGEREGAGGNEVPGC